MEQLILEVQIKTILYDKERRDFKDVAKKRDFLARSQTVTA
jgi:hypothetical protein